MCQGQAPGQGGQVLGEYNYEKDSGSVVHTTLYLRLLEAMDDIDFGDGDDKDNNCHNHHHHNDGCGVIRCAGVALAVEVQEEGTQYSRTWSTTKT